jgi:hypothetical protein
MPYKLGSVNTKTEVFYPSEALEIEELDLEGVEREINNLIREIRLLRFKDYDDSIDFVIKSLSDLGLKKI